MFVMVNGLAYLVKASIIPPQNHILCQSYKIIFVKREYFMLELSKLLYLQYIF